MAARRSFFVGNQRYRVGREIPAALATADNVSLPGPRSAIAVLAASRIDSAVAERWPMTLSITRLTEVPWHHTGALGFLRLDGHPHSGAQPAKGCPSMKERGL